MIDGKFMLKCIKSKDLGFLHMYFGKLTFNKADHSVAIDLAQ